MADPKGLSGVLIEMPGRFFCFGFVFFLIFCTGSFLFGWMFFLFDLIFA